MSKQLNKPVRYSAVDLTKMRSHTDFQKLGTLKDEEIDYSDLPEVDANFWSRAEVRDHGPKQAISIRLDSDVLDWFKHQQGRYQKLINQVLRRYMDAHR